MSESNVQQSNPDVIAEPPPGALESHASAPGPGAACGGSGMDQAAHEPAAQEQQGPQELGPQGEVGGGEDGGGEPPAKRARLDGEEQQQQERQEQQQQQHGPDEPPPDLPAEEEPDEEDDAARGGGSGSGGGTGPRAPSARDYRLRQRRWWALKRRFADLTAQVEAALCEAKALIAWRTTPRPPRAARLSPQEREVLAVQHNRRLFDVASKACLAVIKAMMVQKFSWPFNHPVDIKRFPDYCQTVSEPMDFGTMKDKAERGGYRDPQQVYTDFMLVFNNSRQYNPPGSDVYYMSTVLQEAFLEQWKKVVLPKLQECAKQSAAEEATMNARKLAMARTEEEREMQDAACKLVAFLDDLHEQLAAVRVDAALACEPLAPEARVELARALAALPTAQLEAALGLVLPQMAPHLASAPAPDSRQEVEVDLGRCSALELRQLQSFLGACCTAAGEGQQQQQQQHPGGGGTAEGAAVAREVSGFPAGVLREQTLSEHAGVVWPGVVVGAGLKARNTTLLPGGPRTDDPAAPALLPATKGAPSKARPDAVASAAVAAGAGASALGPPPAKPSGARRFSDTGTSALRPPLPPQRSRLGQQPATPTHGGVLAGVHAAHNPHHTPFASPAAGTTAAGDALAQQQQHNQSLGGAAEGPLRSMSSTQGSSDQGHALGSQQRALDASAAAALRSGEDVDMAGL